MDGFFARSGSVLGHVHRRKGINNQDAIIAPQTIQVGDTSFSFGAVFDGCTGGKDSKHSRNEVAAILLSAFVASEAPLILASHTPLSEFSDMLYNRIVGYLGSIARSTVMGSPDTVWQFVQRHLLSTVLGYITDGSELVVFCAGDGVVLVNGEPTVIDQNDQPMYPAYQLLDKRLLGGISLPDSFETVTLSLNDIDRFAISTDGIKKCALAKPDFMEGIWSYETSARAGLQWHLNIGANESLFEDDCSVVAFARKIKP